MKLARGQWRPADSLEGGVGGDALEGGAGTDLATYYCASNSVAYLSIYWPRLSTPAMLRATAERPTTAIDGA